jgi:hypothetical protein
MSRFLYWLTGHLPCRIICDEDKPYLERYYLFTLLGVRFYIHRFVGSDPARCMHDHPWPWAGSVVLSGYYFEERRGMEQSGIAKVMAILNGTAGTTRSKVRWFNWLLGDSFHRVILAQVDNRERHCWTLFFHCAAYTKPWGFLRRVENNSALMVWVPHNYPKDGAGTPSPWWNQVPVGNVEPRRQPCQ